MIFSKSAYIKKGVLALWLGIIGLCIVTLFWYNAWLYDLPTPVPTNYKVVNTGTKIQIPQSLNIDRNKPVFLHFFNPDCPCSRFNKDHFKSIVKQYGTAVNFIIVPVVKHPYSTSEIQQKIGLALPVLFDTTLASTCGVYSTPQAVIINNDSGLYYRGNYNKSRYCSNEETSYARLALKNLLQHQPNAVYNQFALKAYGCSLPICTK